MSTVGFLGLGSMGSGIAGRLVAAGHEVIVWNRSSGAVAALVDRGATAARDAGEALSADVSFSMLANDEAVESVFDPVTVAGLAGRTHVMMASISPALADRLTSQFEAAGGSGGAQDQAAESTGGGPDTAALLKELKRKRTKDKRATEIVAQLEAAEVESEELAKALTARGKALFASPERAKAMFELALGKDAELPDPAFELAKQAAVLGELDEAKKWLKVVHERKGKKLLKQIEFDPMWEILKDDPDVRALLK